MDQLTSHLSMVSITHLLQNISRLLANKVHWCLKLSTEWDFTAGLLTDFIQQILNFMFVWVNTFRIWVKWSEDRALKPLSLSLTCLLLELVKNCNTTCTCFLNKRQQRNVTESVTTMYNRWMVWTENTVQKMSLKLKCFAKWHDIHKQLIIHNLRTLLDHLYQKHAFALPLSKSRATCLQATQEPKGIPLRSWLNMN